MGKVPHRKRLTRRKDRDPRKRKRPSETHLKDDSQQSTDSLFVDDAQQILIQPCDKVSKSPPSSKHTSVVPVSDPVPLTPLVEKLKRHLRRIRYENSSRLDNNTLLIP